MTTPIYDSLLSEAKETLGLDWDVKPRPTAFGAYYTLWCAQKKTPLPTRAYW